MARFLKIMVGLAVLGGGGFWGWRTYTAKQTGPAVDEFRTATVNRGDLVVNISATGTLQPEKVIDVGAQVAGLIVSFGTDLDGKPIDYGSRIEEGMVLATIDDTLYAADAAQAEAQVQSATAGIARAEADVTQAKARHAQSERDWKRAQDIGPSDALSRAAYEKYQADFDTAAAAVAVTEATVLQARASLAQAQAQQRKAQRNLAYCTIKSPVRGVIIDRRVNIGQTVVASLNAPSLFLLAKDLTRMQVWAQVNEADIGRIRAGQKTTMTVDAFPGVPFPGTVGKVRLNASMSQNVVTYTVEINTDNPDGRLLPYLTASLQFEINRVPDTLQVPSAALRWKPTPDQLSPGVTPPESPGGPGARPGPPGGGGARTLWVREGSKVRPLAVSVGETDGLQTAVSGDNLKEGLEIVLGTKSALAGAPAASNPFAPRMGSGSARPAATGRPAGGGH
jgi:HlyD family secretion protein